MLYGKELAQSIQKRCKIQPGMLVKSTAGTTVSKVALVVRLSPACEFDRDYEGSRLPQKHFFQLAGASLGLQPGHRRCAHEAIQRQDLFLPRRRLCAIEQRRALLDAGQLEYAVSVHVVSPRLGRVHESNRRCRASRRQ